MTLSAGILTRLERAEKQALSYLPSKEVAESIKNKSLVMLVAPAVTGKSHLIKEMAKQDSDFHTMPIFTTRDSRPDDDPRYFHIIPHTEEGLGRLLDSIEAKQVVQYAVHPTTKHIYGTVASDYPGRFNLLATLSHTVAPLQKLPFASTHVIGLVTEPHTWKQWFIARYPDVSSERTKRLNEAIFSLEWLIDHDTEVHWAINRQDKASTVATSIINEVKYNQSNGKSGSKMAKGMLAIAQALL